MAPSLSGETELLINKEVAENPTIVPNRITRRTSTKTSHTYTRLEKKKINYYDLVSLSS